MVSIIIGRYWALQDILCTIGQIVTFTFNNNKNEFSHWYWVMKWSNLLSVCNVYKKVFSSRSFLPQTQCYVQLKRARAILASLLAQSSTKAGRSQGATNLGWTNSASLSLSTTSPPFSVAVWSLHSNYHVPV